MNEVIGAADRGTLRAKARRNNIAPRSARGTSWLRNLRPRRGPPQDPGAMVAVMATAFGLSRTCHPEPAGAAWEGVRWSGGGRRGIPALQAGRFDECSRWGQGFDSAVRKNEALAPTLFGHLRHSWHLREPRGAVHAHGLDEPGDPAEIEASREIGSAGATTDPPDVDSELPQWLSDRSSCLPPTSLSW